MPAYGYARITVCFTVYSLQDELQRAYSLAIVFKVPAALLDVERGYGEIRESAITLVVDLSVFSAEAIEDENLDFHDFLCATIELSNSKCSFQTKLTKRVPHI